MKSGFLCKRAFCFVTVVVFLAVFPAALSALSPGKTPGADKGNDVFFWNFYWTGSWNKEIKTTEDGTTLFEDIFAGGTLFNRGNLSLDFTKPDLSLRFMATDKRVLPFREDDNKAGFNPGFGIYHRGTGSRFLYGVQNEYGLPARITNVWHRSVPFTEARLPSSRDLKTEPSAKDTDESSLYLAFPLGNFSVFASAALDKDLDTALGGGFGFDDGGKSARLEGFYTRKELPPRKAQSWFSSSPPLPERDFDIFALGLIFNSPFVSFAGDWARSEMFALGRGMYGSAALTLGNKPWRFSFAGDGAESAFADRKGYTAGAGLRVSARGERFWPRSGLLRFQGALHSPAPGEDFNRGVFSFYCRPPAPGAAQRRTGAFPLRLSRVSLGVQRDARKPEKTLDTLNISAAINAWFLSGVFSCSLHYLSPSAPDTETASLFQNQFSGVFESRKVSAELGFRAGIWNLKPKLAYTSVADGKGIWETSFSCSARPGRWGRMSFKIASQDFPEKWDYTLSWRFAY